MPDLLQSDSAEFYKGALHGAAAVLCATFGFYAIGAYVARPKAERERRLLVNAGLYALGTGWEAVQTFGHWRNCGR